MLMVQSVARALHDYGRRRKSPFVAVNMAAIPRELIESDLFGHEKGAFTGATARMAGRFEQAEGGTLFLDEIGDMPMEAQTRLLRVLQQGEYVPVGARTPIRANVRIVAATNKNLTLLIQQGLFREDLFFRLNVVPVRLPPLRERTEDIPDLVRHFFTQAEREGLGGKYLDKGALERLKRHPWPGNVRELENLVRRLAAPPARVFEAWTDPALVAQWFGPQRTHVDQAELDAANATAYAASYKAFAEKWRTALARWEAAAAPLKGKAVVSQHKAWAYLYDWLGLKEVGTLEPKPGIEPSVAWLGELAGKVAAQQPKAVIRPAYSTPRAAEWFGNRAGIPVVVLPFTVGGDERAKDLFGLFDDTVARLVEAVR